MEAFINYINSVLPDKHGENTLYKFKKKTLDEMNARANEVAAHGLTNKKVVEDLIISEYSDLKAAYSEFYKKEHASENTKKHIIYNLIGSAIYLLTIVVLFLGTGFVTHNWAQVWVIMADGVLLWTVYLLSLGVRKFTSMKRIFHIFARIFLAGAVIVSMVALFLLVVALTDIEHSWLIIMFGLIAMLVCDGIYATAAHHRLVLFNWLLYIPAIAAFLFIIIGVLGIIPWGVAWLIIPASLIVDLAIIMLAISKNKLEKMEVADTWNEN